MPLENELTQNEPSFSIFLSGKIEDSGLVEDISRVLGDRISIVVEEIHGMSGITVTGVTLNEFISCLRTKLAGALFDAKIEGAKEEERGEYPKHPKI